MPTYILLTQWTQKGIENVKESPSRLDAARKLFRSLGAELKAFYLVLGRYDHVAVIEAPNDETMAKVALALGSRGAVHTETLRAFTEEEYRKILGDLP